jgi:hypothetical protein
MDGPAGDGGEAFGDDDATHAGGGFAFGDAPPEGVDVETVEIGQTADVGGGDLVLCGRDGVGQAGKEHQAMRLRRERGFSGAVRAWERSAA